MEQTSKELEAAFSSFLNRLEYDQAESALFALTRSAFLAGWAAAQGKPFPEQPADPLLEAETKFGWKHLQTTE